MELQNFGSIFNFAVELEAADRIFYRNAAENPACIKHKAFFEGFARDEEKNEQVMLRTRRENVTEMILEPISDFSRTPFLANREGVGGMSLSAVITLSLDLENKAERFYIQAAEKLKALPEASRVLIRTAAKRAQHKMQLEALSHHTSSI
jgi:rubrerythrin